MKIILIIFFIMINISNVLAVENDCSGLNKLSQDYANCIAKKLKKIEDIGFIELEQKDVIRHEVVRKIINAYEQKNKN